MSKSVEKGVDPAPAISGLEIGDGVQRLGQLADRIDRLQQVVDLGRRWRLAFPAYLGLALGLRVVWGLSWPLLFKGGLAIAVAMGYLEIVTWWYSKKIRKWEQELDEPVRPD